MSTTFFSRSPRPYAHELAGHERSVGVCQLDLGAHRCGQRIFRAIGEHDRAGCGCRLPSGYTIVTCCLPSGRVSISFFYEMLESGEISAGTEKLTYSGSTCTMW